MNKKHFLFLLIIVSVILIAFLFYSIDKKRCTNDKTPWFTFLTIYYKDGGTQYKIGMGYSVIIWKQLAEINLNNTIIRGYKVGKEFIKFPLCYLKIFSHNLEPITELQFLPNEYDKELYEENDHEYFNVKIIRKENNGRMNIIPCNVFIYDENMEAVSYGNTAIFNLENKKQIDRNNNEYFYLLGGETAFLTLFYGNYKIKIITPKKDQVEYLPDYNKDWESIIYNFCIPIGKYKEIRIIPGSSNKSVFNYNGTWIIEEE